MDIEEYDSPFECEGCGEWFDWESMDNWNVYRDLGYHKVMRTSCPHCGMWYHPEPDNYRDL